MARQTFSDELTLKRYSLLNGQEVIVLGKPRLPLLIHHQYELDHSGGLEKCCASVVSCHFVQNMENNQTFANPDFNP